MAATSTNGIPSRRVLARRPPWSINETANRRAQPWRKKRPLKSQFPARHPFALAFFVLTIVLHLVNIHRGAGSLIPCCYLWAGRHPIGDRLRYEVEHAQVSAKLDYEYSMLITQLSDVSREISAYKKRLISGDTSHWHQALEPILDRHRAVTARLREIAEIRASL
jgi:hypothetical protein